MGKSRQQIHCYDYVNHPYEKVRAELVANADQVFREATSSAQSRARSVAAGLHVNIGGMEIAREIDLQVTGINETGDSDRRTAIGLAWEASDAPQFFPVMNGELAAYPITSTETQLDFRGDYQPPLGIVGRAIDAMVGHRIAEASVHQFIREVADYLRARIDY